MLHVCGGQDSDMCEDGGSLERCSGILQVAASDVLRPLRDPPVADLQLRGPPPWH